MLARQGTVFHFRRAVPARLREVIGKREIWVSLRTSSATVARVRAGLVYAVTQEAFEMADVTRRGDAPRGDAPRDEVASLPMEQIKTELKAAADNYRRLAGARKGLEDSTER